MRPAPGLRRREKGQSAVVLALSGVTLVAIVGLALDGGMAVGAYRHAQNAADAGALAAARQIYLNGLALQPSTAGSLTPIAQAEVERNGATLGEASGSGSVAMDGGDTMTTADGTAVPYATAASRLGWVFTGAQTVYVPNVGQGLTGASDLFDVSATAGTSLVPVAATLQLAQTRSNAIMQLPSSGGSTAFSQVAVGMQNVPSLDFSATANCWQSSAAYHQGQNTVGAATACPSSTGSTAGLWVSGALVTGYGTDARVDADNHPAAAPRVTATSPAGGIGPVSVSATSASSATTLGWDAVGGLSVASATVASGVHLAYLPSGALQTALTVDAASIAMWVTISVNAQGQTSVSVNCVPTTVTLGGTLVGAVQTSVNVDSSCNTGSIGIAGISVPSIQPAAASACSTAASTGVVTCAIQACFLRAAIPATPTAVNACIGENTLTLSASPETSAASTPPCTDPCTSPSPAPSSSSSATPSPAPSSSAAPSPTPSPTPTSSSNPWFQYTGEVTVTAEIDQPTYFLQVLGWNHTTPSATATADVEPVIDESSSAFAASPFGMPDMAWSMGAGSVDEHLTVGHSYYLYGPSMAANSPAPMMPSGWQGQLAAGSAHRVGAGHVVTGVSGLTTTPQPYMPDGAYVLEPVFNPVSGVVECYGVFVRVAGQQNWYTLVNSAPAAGGFTVQATSVSGWITFDEGAVSVKLVQ